jgi:hypothetical protein
MPLSNEAKSIAGQWDGLPESLRAQLKQQMTEAERAMPAAWPTYWRVVAPCAGGYDHDLVFICTTDEAKARTMYAGLIESEHPVRLERVSCGPLPAGYSESLAELRSASPQNAGAAMRPVLAAWEVTS